MDNYKNSNKQRVRKSLCPTEMLWVELRIFFFNPNVIYNKIRTIKVTYEIISRGELPKLNITYLLGTSWLSCRNTQEIFLLY